MPLRLGSAIWLLAAPLLAQSPNPPRTDAGPLLAFTTGTVSESASLHTLHFVPTSHTAEPTAIWRSQEPAEVLQRLGRDHVLLAHHDEPGALVLVNLSTGAHRRLPDSHSAGFVTVHGSEVVHLGRSSTSLPDDFLYGTSWRGTGSHRRLDSCRLQRVARVFGSQVLGIGSDERQVRAIDLTRGKGRTLCLLPEGLHDLTLAVSPDGKRAAIGAVDAATNGDLRIVDIDSGRLLGHWPDLPIYVAPLSDYLPRLEVAFASADQVVCSETRGEPDGLQSTFVHVTRSLISGGTVAERRYALLGHRHQLAPPLPTEPPSLWFRAEQRGQQQLLLRAGVSEPVCSLPVSNWLPRQLWIAPDGRAAVAQAATGGCRLFTIDHPAGRQLTTDCARNFTWLPAAPK